MTRHERWEWYLDLTPVECEVSDIINSIYDDFESRTCENCKHGHYMDILKNDIWCLCENSPIYDCNTELDFGCNKFVRKQ